MCITLDFFFILTVGVAHLLYFDRTPVFTYMSSSSLICSNKAKGPFHYFLNTGWTLSFSLDFAIILVHPLEKIFGLASFSSFFSFSASASKFSIFLAV